MNTKNISSVLYPNNLTIKRVLLGFTYESAAQKTNLDPQTIAHWEQGNKLPNIIKLIPLLKLYNTTLEEMYPELFEMYNYLEEEHLERLNQRLAKYIKALEKIVMGYYKIITIEDKELKKIRIDRTLK